MKIQVYKLYANSWKILFSATSPAPYSLLLSAKSVRTISIAIQLANPIRIKRTVYSG